MNYQEVIKNAVQGLYETTKECATSRHYTFGYGWVSSHLGVNLSNKKVRNDVWEMSYSDEFCDLIQTVDFDDDRKEVTIMLWKSNNKKWYKLKDYEKFCSEALICPSFEDEEQIDEWFKNHKIHIAANNCVMELEYDADTTNEIEFSLREIYNAILGDGTATTGNTVGSEYRPAEFKDIVRCYIVHEYESGGSHWFKYAKLAKQNLSVMSYFAETYQKILECGPSQYEDFGCDFSRFNPATLKNITKEGIERIILDWVGSDIEISYDPKTDKTFIIDYTFMTCGDLIGWYWGSPDDTETQYRINCYRSAIFK